MGGIGEREMGQQNWVQPGVEVMEVRSGWETGYGRIQKIAKVYANGNFLVEGSPQQWRPWGDWTARKTGEHGWHFAYLHLVTPKLLAERDRARLVAKARQTIRAELDRLTAIKHEDGLIAEAAAIKARTP
jgi:hypothetical protein